MDCSVQGLAARQLADYRTRKPGTFFGEGNRPRLSMEEAYAVQAEVAALRATEGEPVVGYKVGCTGANVREQFGMDGPIRGFVYETELHPSGVELSHASYANLAVEGELAVRLGDDAEIERVFPVVEPRETASSAPRARPCRSSSPTTACTPAWCSPPRKARGGAATSAWVACCGSTSPAGRSRRDRCRACPAVRRGRWSG